jgi:hypothetical protein
MLFAFAPIKWITPINTTRIMASMIAYSPTPWPCSDRSLFKLKRPKLLASRKSVGSMFTFSLHRQEWPNSGNPKVTTTGLTTVIKTPIRLGRGLGSPTERQGLEVLGDKCQAIFYPTAWTLHFSQRRDRSLCSPGAKCARGAYGHVYFH